MKLSSLLLSLSLLLNACLVGLFVAGSFSTRPAVVEKTAQTSVAPAAASAPSPTWSRIETRDLAKERDRLRAEGFPPSVIRAILLAQIRDRFAAQRKAIDDLVGAAPYWKPYSPTPAIAEARLALAREEQKLLRELLGRDADTAFSDSLKRQFPGFSDDKIDQVAAIKQRYDDARQNIYGAYVGQFTPDQRQQLAALDKSMHTEFAGVLTPAELEDYDLRVSQTANQLRYQMRSFEPTESEFRTIFQLQRTFNELGATTPASTPDEMRARGEAYMKLKADIAAALGPARAAEYERSSDYNYQRTLTLTDRLQLPSQTANDLYALQKEFQDRRTAMYRSSPSPEAATSAKGMETEAIARVKAVFNGDEKAFEAYQQNCGSWLRIAPRTATATPPKP